ncbi:efflux RND transporter periplasmic adaptor subunit [Thalassospira lucentensis]|uniref:efflux RND transporter periplasmic adaptor subunit n=1 Tax=Thalassospira lucentensis TaxID=168935 RepID=UPI00142D8CA1|nr:efflux RND transporter periplasmic adaptor subunit [Thalassospira lucentensis]NIZ02914.1 efflux RND transporter periplasmic adaptor subunit [Thalassospira lucentensis]
MKLSNSLGRLLMIGGIIVVALVVIASASSVLEKEQQEAELTEFVSSGSIEETVLAHGELQPANIVSVGAQVSGQLKALHVELGQKISAGDLIAEIDPTAQKYALRIAEAALANIKAQRKARSFELKRAQQAYKRQKSMALQRAASMAELETAEAAYKALAADIEALEAQIAQATVEVENAKANLGYTNVVAPIDGVVVAVVTKAGQTLNSNLAVPTIVVLAQLDVMKVKVRISEADITRVKPGQTARFTIMGETRAPTVGKLEQIAPAPTSIAAESTTTSKTSGQQAQAVYFNGIFTTPNPDGLLRPMMTTLVSIVVGQAEDVPLVPWSALTEHDQDGRYHLRVRSPSGEITERLVSIGLTDRIKAQVIDGLAVGDEVVIPADGQASDSNDMGIM